MENDLISRSALIDEIEGIYKRHYEKSCYQFIHDFFKAIFRRINKAPAVDASTLRPTGRWIEEEFETMGVRMIRQKCSECGRYEWQKEKYCHCGCKMEG